MCGFKCHLKANTILTALKDQIIHLYIMILTPVASEFDKVSRLFQFDTIDAQKMTKELQMHSDSLRYWIYNERGQRKAMSLCDFGAHFLSDMQKPMQKSPTLRKWRKEWMTWNLIWHVFSWIAWSSWSRDCLGISPSYKVSLFLILCSSQSGGT